MIEIFKDKELEIYFSNLPRVDVRYILPWTNEEEKKEIKHKPFICENEFKVLIKDVELNEEFLIEIPKNYAWDGASIPRVFWRLIGSNTDNSFLMPSCIHDILCENHDLINHDRNLSSRIFRSLLIASGVTKFKAQTMYLAVDNFQKFCGWGVKV